MSNIGKRLIQIPKNVTITITEPISSNSVKIITIKGPLGISKLNIPRELKINVLEDPIQNNKSISIVNSIITKKDNIKELSAPVTFQKPCKSENDFIQTVSKNKIWGTFRSVIANTIIGVSQGFQVNLKIVGVGYRASVECIKNHKEKTEDGKKNEKNMLVLKLGFSHLINLEIPKTINVNCPKPTRLILRSNNLSELMQYAAKIRSYKQPEPYKGKGILYKGEKIRRKEGKKK